VTNALKHGDHHNAKNVPYIASHCDGTFAICHLKGKRREKEASQMYFMLPNEGKKKLWFPML
jgi:hypothetical protein